MRIIYMGTPEFAVAPLRALVDRQGADITCSIQQSRSTRCQ